MSHTMLVPQCNMGAPEPSGSRPYLASRPPTLGNSGPNSGAGARDRVYQRIPQTNTTRSVSSPANSAPRVSSVHSAASTPSSSSPRSVSFAQPLPSGGPNYAAPAADSSALRKDLDQDQTQVDIKQPSQLDYHTSEHRIGIPHLDPEREQLKRHLQSLAELTKFLVTAPQQFVHGDIIRQFKLPSDEKVSCVRWNDVFCITGTDIVRSIAHRFLTFGRDIVNRKKFEEGIFSDLRNLKVNIDAMLENPKSELLEFLYKKNCVRTKKKQKVFFWHSVNHDQLFLDALERELKKEAAVEASKLSSSSRKKSSLVDMSKLSAASTVAAREPALSFQYESEIPLAEQVPFVLKQLIESLGISDTIYAAAGSHSAPGNLPGSGPSFNFGPANVPSTPYSLYSKPSKGDFTSSINERLSHGTLKSISPYIGSAASPGILYNAPAALTDSQFYYQHQKLHHAQPVSGHMEHQRLPLPRQASNHNVDGASQRDHEQETKLHQQVPSQLYQQHQYLARNNTEKPYRSSHRIPQDSQGYSDNISWITGELDTGAAANSQIMSPDNQSEETDFPLEVLVREDQASSHPLGANQFESKFTDFAYHNRPAVIFGKNGTPLVPLPNTQSPHLGPAIHPPDGPGYVHPEYPYFPSDQMNPHIAHNLHYIMAQESNPPGTREPVRASSMYDDHAGGWLSPHHPSYVPSSHQHQHRTLSNSNPGRVSKESLALSDRKSPRSRKPAASVHSTRLR